MLDLLGLQRDVAFPNERSFTDTLRSSTDN
jgi:hypothetical protein